MNKNFAPLMMSLFITVAFSSCYYDKAETLYPGSCIVAGSVQGPQYTNVKAIINSQCSGGSCHTNGGSAGNYNFDSDCSIITHWQAINDAVSNDRMPIGSPLNTTDKQAIADWIGGGHGYTN